MTEEFKTQNGLYDHDVQSIEMIRSIFYSKTKVLVVERASEVWAQDKWIAMPEELGGSWRRWDRYVARMQALQDQVPQKKKPVILFLQRSMRQQVQKSGGAPTISGANPVARAHE